VLIAHDLLKRVKNRLGRKVMRTIACHERVYAGILHRKIQEYQYNTQAKRLIQVENEFSNWSLLRINISNKFKSKDFQCFLIGLVMIENTEDILAVRVYRKIIGTVNKTATRIDNIN